MDNVISWFDIPVHDLDRAAAFYGQILEAELQTYEAGPGVKGGRGYFAYFQDVEGNRVGLHSRG